MPAQTTSPREAVLLDTDIGSDIDDAVCLAYLLRQPRCELLGVTTVSGPVKQRAALASAVCRAAGRGEVPVRAGQSNGILIDEVQPRCPQDAVLPRFDHAAAESFESNAAVGFLREQIRARPDEITLLAIGPMTNLALLFTLDPEIPRLLKRLVLMCGSFTTRTPGVKPVEWNAKCDPIATAAVYRAPAKPHRSIGLDVTVRCRMPAPECVASLVDGGDATVAEVQDPIFGDRPWDNDPHASLFGPDDLVPLKPKVDVLLAGHAYSPDGVPVPELVATLRVGDFAKSLRVTGDRFWSQGPAGLVASEPMPFSSMPIRYERAARSMENPVGIDLEAERPGSLAAANIEAEEGWMPGFGAISPAWPLRR